MKTERGRKCYQSIWPIKLSGRQIFFRNLKRHHHERSINSYSSVLTTITGAKTSLCRKILQNVSPYFAHSAQKVYLWYTSSAYCYTPDHLGFSKFFASLSWAKDGIAFQLRALLIVKHPERPYRLHQRKKIHKVILICSHWNKMSVSL